MTSCFSVLRRLADLAHFKKRWKCQSGYHYDRCGPSESWPLTASLRRECGSIHVSTLIKALEDETGEARDDDAVMTTREFGDAISVQLRETSPSAFAPDDGES